MLLVLPYQPHRLISMMKGHPFDHRGRKKSTSWIVFALDPRRMGCTMIGAMDAADIRKFDKETLPPFDYGYEGCGQSQIFQSIFWAWTATVMRRTMIFWIPNM
jgi:hypothetical protein